MKKNTFSIILLFASIFGFAQTNPNTPEIVNAVKEHFNKYEAIVEATVLSTKLDSIDGKLLNEVRLKLHKDYKGTFPTDEVLVYMAPDDELRAEYTGVYNPCRLSHGGCPKTNPASGISGHFFMQNVNYNGTQRRLIIEWDGYPNKEYYNLVERYNKDRNVPVYFYKNFHHTFGVFSSVVQFETLEELEAYLNSIDVSPAQEFDQVLIIYYAPPSPFAPQINIDSLDNANKLRGQEMQRKGEESMRKMEEIIKLRAKKNPKNEVLETLQKEQTKFLNDLEENTGDLRNELSTGTSGANDEIEVEIDNFSYERDPISTKRYIVFDILISDNVSEGYLSNALAWITYNTNVFDIEIVTVIFVQTIMNKTH